MTLVRSRALVANGLSGVAADRARAKLWNAVGGDKTAVA
ncbi:MAG: hypothetical protein QOF40_2352 [Actinomycetota bacterium]|jgi:hypothetical protein|nr:hypothetical protein [Actinomycetota bacterium]